MATIEKRSGKGGTTWPVRVRRLGQPQLTKSFETKKAAQEWAAEPEAKVFAGEQLATSEARKRTVTDAIDRYLEVTLPRCKHR